MSPAWSVGIVVPASEEAEHIGSCVTSILEAELPPHVLRWVVVVADACTDATARRAAAALGTAGEVLEVEHRNVGAARRCGTAAVLARLRARGASPQHTWLATTDADSTVHRSWLRVHLAHARRGAAAVAGTVRLEPHDPEVLAAPAAADAFLRQYTIHADGSHPHVHGANLGLRADVYLAVGGWGVLATAEDHDLWNRIHATGLPTVSTTAAPVTTSGRHRGRAPDGFAGLLASLTDEASTPCP